jgi:hypothetical protein
MLGRNAVSIPALSDIFFRKGEGMNTTEQKLATAARGLELLKERRKGKEFNARDTIILNWIECILEARLNPVEILMEAESRYGRADLFVCVVDYTRRIKTRRKQYRYPPVSSFFSLNTWNRDDLFLFIAILICFGCILFMLVTAPVQFIGSIVAGLIGVIVCVGFMNWVTGGKFEEAESVSCCRSTGRVQHDLVSFTDIWDASNALITMSPNDNFLASSGEKFPIFNIAEDSNDIFNLIGFYRGTERTTLKQVWGEIEDKVGIHTYS